MHYPEFRCLMIPIAHICDAVRTSPQMIEGGQILFHIVDT